MRFSADAPVIPTTSWFNYDAENARIFKSNLEKTIAKYAIYLDSDIIESIDSLANSILILFLIALDNHPNKMADIDKELGIINRRDAYTMLDQDAPIKKWYKTISLCSLKCLIDTIRLLKIP